jgi:large subunit ribosomal protein L18e
MTKKNQVNLFKINRHTKKGEAVIVQGKVLAKGSLDHPVKIAAKGFSKNALKKIEDAGGKVISTEEAKKTKARVMK